MSRPRPASKRFFTKDELENSPSVRAGLDRATEAKYRFNNTQFMRDCARDLKLPWFVVETAVIFTHRYFAVRSHFKNDKFVVGTACLFLATKVDNSPRSINDVVRTCLTWRCHASKLPAIRAQLHSQEYFETLREDVLIAESAVLCALSYDMSVDHPFNSITRTVKQLLGEDVANNPAGVKLLQSAQNMCNDSMSTTLGIQYPAEHIGAAAVYVSAKLRKAPLPWAGGLGAFSERFGIRQESLDDIEAQMLARYHYNAEAKAAAAAAAVGPALLPPAPRMLPPAPCMTKAQGAPVDGEDDTRTGGASTSTREPAVQSIASSAERQDAAPPAAAAVGSQGALCSKGSVPAAGAGLMPGVGRSVALDSAGSFPPAALTPDGGGDVRRPPSPVPQPSPSRRKRPLAAPLADSPAGSVAVGSDLAASVSAELGAAAKRARLQEA